MWLFPFGNAIWMGACHRQRVSIWYHRCYRWWTRNAAETYVSYIYFLTSQTQWWRSLWCKCTGSESQLSHIFFWSFLNNFLSSFLSLHCVHFSFASLFYPRVKLVGMMNWRWNHWKFILFSCCWVNHQSSWQEGKTSKHRNDDWCQEGSQPFNSTTNLL